MPRSSDLSIRKPELKALYARIGGEEGLERILKDFYHRMEKDIMIGFFFFGKDVEKIAMMQKQFLMRAFGATESYSGKAPADAHTALAPIRRGFFDRRLRILEETLAAHGVAPEDIRTWVAFESAFREGVES